MTARIKPKDQAFRDEIAARVLTVCVSDLSRQLSNMTMPIDQAPRAIEFISWLSYHAADAMLAARERKS